MSTLATEPEPSLPVRASRLALLAAGALFVAHCASHAADDAGDAPVAPRDATVTDRALDVAADTASPGPDAAPDATRDAAVVDAAWTPDDPGVFVVVGYAGRRLRSLDDGATWIDDQQLEAVGGDDTSLLRTVVWGGGGFVALGWRAMTSPDGHAWTDAAPNLGQWIGAAIWAQGHFVSIGGYGWRRTSADGVHWTSFDANPTVACHAHDGLAFGDVMGGRYVMADDNGARFYSTDGHTWHASTGGDPSEQAVAFGNGVFVALGPRMVARSTDGGQTWTATATLGANVGGLVFAQGRFLALARGHAYTSTDGVAWADHASADVPGEGLAYGHGTYVSVSSQGMHRSSDGLTWTSAYTNTASSSGPEWIAFGPLATR